MDVLKRKYKALKARLTIVIREIESSDITEHSAVVFNKQLEEIWKKMCDVQDSMVEVSDEDTLETLCTNHGEEEIRFMNARLKISNVRERSTSEQSQASSVAEVRLPRLELPTFSGDITEWSTFYDLFTAGVHNNSTLSDAQKMQYLKSSVKGQAATLIKHLPITEENYLEAWELLRQRYDNKRLTANIIAQRLLTLPNVKEGKSLQQLLDQFLEADRALRVCLPNGNLWDTLMVNIISNNLDNETLQAWELSLKTTDVPALNEFINFLTIRARAVALKTGKQNASTDKHDQRCPGCKDHHPVRFCPKFEKMDVDNKWDFVRKHNLCRNCLSSRHSTYDCKAKKCKKCEKGHHTSLHRDFKKEVAGVAMGDTDVLLPTAIVAIIDNKGNSHQVRALLDSGSQVNILSLEVARKLKLKTSQTRRQLQTVAGTCQLPREASLTLKGGDWQQTVRCLLTNQLGITLPTQQITSSWRHIDKLKLADAKFKEPRGIDLILGMGIVSSLLTKGFKKGTEHQPVAQNSKLGWLISGPTMIQDKGSKKCLFSAEINQTLRQFWEVEEVPVARLFSPEESKVEEHYKSNTVRLKDGCYEVKYPFIQEPAPIGESREQGIRRFLQLENSLRRKGIKEQYAKVIEEYLRLGHMIPVNPKETEEPACFLPHHAVMKDSMTTSLRVVFDASAKTTNDKSLNDVMMNGPKLQEDLFHVLIRFQSHLVALCADIEKMYRQINVHPSHQRYQRIIWRDAKDKPLKEFQLTRVTFGMKAAPYLAIKTLQRLADDEKHRFPKAAEIVRKDFYVDDLLTGATSAEEARVLQKELTGVLQAGGFHLRKWCSNSKEALMNIVQDDLGTELIPINPDETIKTLGIHWNPTKDNFVFFVKLPERSHHSKRTLLSDTAKIFDPMGWLAPVTVQAKMMFQALWCQSLAWDDELPEDMKSAWVKFRESLREVQELEIPRSIASSGSHSITLCGFCDASQKAYGAVLYLRIEEDNQQRTKLLVAKSRVAPLKPLSIPRLELCAAVLLSRLLKETRLALGSDVPAILWTDSEIVLHWIKQPAVRWKTFVANRVVEIQQNANPNCCWYHVDTKENPADLISRGIAVKELKCSTLWWKGPLWLCQSELPRRIGTEPHSIPESRKSTYICSVIQKNSLIQRYSSLDKLLRIMVWMQRFIKRTQKQPSASDKIKVQELRDALTILLRMAQKDVYSKEISSLKRRQSLSNKSTILNLAPFLDSDELLRVGGRLTNCEVPFTKKHQILLPPKHHLTSLIIRDVHIKNLHCGPQLLLNTIRQKFWIPRGKSIIRQYTRTCVTCIQQQVCKRAQIMGNLPAVRVTPSRPFLKSGIDYCGPFTCREFIGRGYRTHKAFIAVFVCLVTKAVHLEVVSALSMEAFMAALNRFIARRGLPSTIYSDNGRNFVAAQKHLKELFVLLTDDENSENLNKTLANRGIQWQFIPPYSPHVGGIWEAAVKSLKFHLRRVCGPNSFTYEELSTIAARIEACLNSRPIHPLSEDVNDLEALTPGHFLIGEPLNSLPEVIITPKDTRTGLSRYRLLQKITQDIWKRWHSDYLVTLQARTKWKTEKPNDINCGDLVIIKDPNSLPQQWKLGRITSVSKGSDGIIRIVNIQTSAGPTQRTINNVIKLPIEDFETVKQPFQGGRYVQSSKG